MLVHLVACVCVFGNWTARNSNIFMKLVFLYNENFTIYYINFILYQSMVEEYFLATKIVSIFSSLYIINFHSMSTYTMYKLIYGHHLTSVSVSLWRVGFFVASITHENKSVWTLMWKNVYKLAEQCSSINQSFNRGNIVRWQPNVNGTTNRQRCYD